jgi:hypothetical protein
MIENCGGKHFIGMGAETSEARNHASDVSVSGRESKYQNDQLTIGKIGMKPPDPMMLARPI